MPPYLPDSRFRQRLPALVRKIRLLHGAQTRLERELIRTRTGEGRARAKAAGKSLGRRPKLTPHQKQEAIRRRDEGESVRAIARTYNVSASTISRLTA